jgi:hypothetical protein
MKICMTKNIHQTNAEKLYRPSAPRSSLRRASLAVSLANGRSSKPPTPLTAAPSWPNPAPLLLLLLLLSGNPAAAAAELVPAPAASFAVPGGEAGLLLLLLLRWEVATLPVLLPGLLPVLLPPVATSEGMLAIKLLLLLLVMLVGMLLMLAWVMRSMRINWSSGKAQQQQQRKEGAEHNKLCLDML